ncbi:hypothetical protein KUL150_11330 [Alteromonas sp. KUL150]|jgi:hypothetical protein|uniref:hypothetical protein n=1 Tax=Alteromonas sp. KUL150 TaxID=2480805 RepID=UPI0012E41CDB|nr:hypothetical protein [Alteromonas sp. KUL150]GFD85074.1 hypothetical protein KUL150_11330 [Alteromonas sp. KUL150]
MIEENPFLQVGSLRNRNSNTLPKRSKERKKVTREQRHRIEDFEMAKSMGLKVWELYE